MKVNWYFRGTRGHWTSIEGRFEILPVYEGEDCKAIACYELNDYSTGKVYVQYSVSEAKRSAQDFCEKEYIASVKQKHMETISA